MPRRPFAAALVSLGLAAVGCLPSLQGNDPREPDLALPSGFASADPSAPGAAPAASGDQAASEAQATSAAQAAWQGFFDSPELRALISTALENNQELNARLQEIIIARNEASLRRGDYLPRLGAGATVGVERASKSSSQGVSDEAHGLPSSLGNLAFGLSASWEVDIWQKLRNAARAADLRYLASVESRSFMVTQIVAEIARSYYELIAIDNQLDVLRRNIDTLTEALEVVRVEKQAARVTELAVQRFEAEVLRNKSRLYGLEQEKTQLENRINFLVGRYPQGVSRDAQKFKKPLPATLQAGVPSHLLENRPDIRQAELELAAAKLDVKVAKAAFYPSLSIEAGVGYRAFNPKHLVATPESIVYNLAGNLAAPLLNRAAIEAQYRSANARQIQAVLGYERAMLQAFTDVANQLAQIKNLQKGYDLQAQQVEALARSNESSKLLFQSARADYMEVLLTRRDSLDAELELIETKKRQFLAMVNLYQALGGGWRAEK